MQRFSVKEIQNTHSEVLNQAAVEPVLLTEESQPSYVIMSVENYEQLINRLAQLEDLIIGQQVEAALSNSRMVGTETFTAELKRLAALEDNSSVVWRNSTLLKRFLISSKVDSLKPISSRLSDKI
ncbi:type II toxin-antitoxin system prevent-host-death family antitoxin [Aetokthonos hydrillicola]|jgi:prevent-host-death family protein|uniref:type II toxin-antitoxin system prevent-host-death family antitoxin n=1 Tax=Aetokthonos hydrillicola TaxID=1550245 RepID=UPI001ABB4558|nr:type II toxin-antitoxin system prevent-host-death family antitoxin [Aetokthonos hydrillicola]MBO3461281.1 type II toxin-antitoxin system prevent-host-death family antitoxin [Aetokthonos hydrillicola CCALA 1050]MBW4589620.1 type II toxin-antitoxin system prevent-host-death family antitoxin [Aetokthonos hydrillicola CCALA 1050]